MAKGKRCPVCGHWTYRCRKEDYDFGGFVQILSEIKLFRPNRCLCSYCGFFYNEHMNSSEENQAKHYAQEKYK